MSEVYLTKIERKTIFTKSLIFVLIMFIISDLTVTGPFYFNFIPWMYILGLVGSIKKIDNVLMCVIGTFTVFVSSLITQGGFSLSVVISTVITLGLLILGIITGKIIFEFILEHRLVKYIKPSRKTVYIIAIITMAIISCVTVGLYSGNIVTYLNSKANLEEYIKDTYEIDDFSVISTRHNRKVPGKYVYTVKIDEQEVYFVPVTKHIFKDVNVTERLEKLNNELAKETSFNTKELLKKYPLLESASAEYTLEYTKLGVTPDTVVMTIICTVDEENMDSIYDELSSYIKDMLEYKQAQRLVITINKDSMEISEQDVQNITAEYIKGGFEIEEISE